MREMIAGVRSAQRGGTPSIDSRGLCPFRVNLVDSVMSAICPVSG